MNNDKILQMFFDPKRWEYAIEKGCIKGVSKARLYQLCKPEERVRMYLAMKNGEYEIAPPHIALIPKDDGTNREVCVNEPDDRVVCSIANDLLFELMPDMVHPCCKSYQKGIGCGKVVQEISHVICNTEPNANGFIGWKADLSKYFDSVPVEYIDQAFDRVEERHGRSALIDVLRKYYHSDIYITVDKTVDYKYRSLKQGCAVAAWLADVVLYHIDERISAASPKSRPTARSRSRPSATPCRRLSRLPSRRTSCQSPASAPARSRRFHAGSCHGRTLGGAGIHPSRRIHLCRCARGHCHRRFHHGRRL